MSKPCDPEQGQAEYEECLERKRERRQRRVRQERGVWLSSSRPILESDDGEGDDE